MVANWEQWDSDWSMYYSKARKTTCTCTLFYLCNAFTFTSLTPAKCSALDLHVNLWGPSEEVASLTFSTALEQNVELSRTGTRFPAAPSRTSVCTPSRACRTTESMSTPSTCSKRHHRHCVQLITIEMSSCSTGCFTLEAFQGGDEEMLTQQFSGAIYRGNKLVSASCQIVVMGSSGSALYWLH